VFTTLFESVRKKAASAKMEMPFIKSPLNPLNKIIPRLDKSRQVLKNTESLSMLRLFLK
jgi:hypothetical protein